MAVPGKQVKRRLLAMLFTFTMIIFLLIIRVGWIQFVNGAEYQKAAFKQQITGQTISSERGVIYDRNGNELAISVPVFTIVANPSQIKISTKGVDEIAQTLSGILQVDKNNLLTKLQQQGSYSVIKRKVDKETGDEIKAWVDKNKIDGIYIEDDTKRYYPNKNLAAHVIGFTGADNQGLDGIEMEMEPYLKGLPGKILDEVDPGGHEIAFNSKKRVDAQDGLNVVLTIDENIQRIAEKALQNSMNEYKVLQGATAIVMDPRSGEILAMVSKPDFDLNTPFAAPMGVSGFDPNQWKNLKDDDQVKELQKTVWRNMAVNSTYEPGSTFKVVTAAAGLEEATVTPDTPVIDVPIKVAADTINCWYAGGHGKETFREGVYNSCNPVFVKLAQAMGIDTFYKYVRAFGFFDKTQIDLPGEADSIIHKKPEEIDMAVASFGQGFQVTPIQEISAYAAIANGGKLLKPQLVKELTDSKGDVIKKFEPEVIRQVISRKTSETLRDILEGVVAKGTGANAYVKGYRVAGKTGTSETVQNGVRSKERFIASFAAIAPADNPVLCVLVVMDHPSLQDEHSGGMVAGPVAANIIEESLSYLGVERRFTEMDKAMMAQEVSVPEVKNKTVGEAKKLLSQSGLEARVIGNGYNSNTQVVEQAPKPWEVLPEKSIVVLYTSRNSNEVTVKMPYVTNKNISEATQALSNVGLNIKIKGMGTAVKQEFAPGADVPIGKAVEIEFRVSSPED